MLAKTNESKFETLLQNEGGVVPKLRNNADKKWESNVWYLDNGASNHMTGEYSKFKELNEKVTGCVKFKDRSTVEIKGKGDTGITRHYTAPYTPQQNGVVERRNRTVVVMAQSFLKEK